MHTNDIVVIAHSTSAGAIMEEVLPGRETSGSREQRRDQKKAVGDALHGAHRAKEEDRVSASLFFFSCACRINQTVEYCVITKIMNIGHIFFWSSV